MRKRLRITALLIWLMAASTAEAWHETGGAEPIVIGRPPSPTREIMFYAASCGSARYSITLDGQYEDPARRLSSVTVNEKELSAEARDQIVRHLRPGMAIMQALVDQCDPKSPNRGRFRLTISERQQETIETQFFDFWVAPDGSVSDVGFN